MSIEEKIVLRIKELRGKKQDIVKEKPNNYQDLLYEINGRLYELESIALHYGFYPPYKESRGKINNE